MQDVLAAYGKFYALLLQAGYGSWDEYLMDQVRKASTAPIVFVQGNGFVYRDSYGAGIRVAPGWAQAA